MLLYVVGFRNACLFILLYLDETTQYLLTSLRFIPSTVIMNWTSHTYDTHKRHCDVMDFTALMFRVQHFLHPFCSSCKCFFSLLLKNFKNN